MALVINIKVNIIEIKNKVMVYLLGKVEMFTKEILIMIYEMDMVRCIGATEVTIKDNGKMEYSMVKVK
jgi:hypothetical protein